MENVEHNHNDKMSLGFWVYLMTDLVSFAALFAAYAALKANTAGGPSGAELFSLPFVLGETIILLTSSFTCGMMVLAAHSTSLRAVSSEAERAAEQNKKSQVLSWLAVTVFLGAAFLGLELTEFRHLLAEGHGPQRSAFLSAFFTLVGTHGLHIAIGLLWAATAFVMVRLRGLTEHAVSILKRLGIFWHFLDIVWIFIFTIVYLLK